MTTPNTSNANPSPVTSHHTETLHIGQCIKDELVRQGRSITWLAGEVHCTRENLYKIFRKPWINTDMLFKICWALDHYFFKACSRYLGL